jgi:hypothetical protein
MTPVREGHETPAVELVARWDLDKTYLRTEFDTLGDLLRTAVERPDRKRSVPGAAALLRELGKTGARIHILSGSPRQMRGRLEEKLLIDRVRWDDLTLKPNLSNLIRLRFRAMRDQLGYKLPMLLAARARDQRAFGPDAEVREVLVGDDAEADAFVYSLYADVCAGKVARTELSRIMSRGELYTDQVQAALDAVDQLERAPVVRRILIHLDRQTPPSRFSGYGRRVVPFYNYLQAAFVLAADDCLPPHAVLLVASELVTQHRFDADALARSFLELRRRGHLGGNGLADALTQASAELVAEGRLSAPEEVSRMCEALRGYAADPGDSAPEERLNLDYLELAGRHCGGRNRHRRR